ncbi:response regulator receiver domain-containing protein [Halopiger aswanensis]|uniref:Response regulator receiver domain-containing protein n=2 Tax=Halopiger aswanensis TaxID=148449 RepID=A0A3R7KLY9_9EURY|nr:response regulator [Halopiger aswanensis]RKD95950.1 response regulator receiver domain-containing protein [Halopiger aswanensis]
MAGPPTEDAITILLVEPNPGDARLFDESFADANIACDVHTVSDGTNALDFVHRRNDHVERPRPDLVLLDFHLPGVSGEDVLTELKSDPAFRRIPVIVMTSSDTEEDIARSYDLHANAYVQKPIEPDEFVELVRSFENFWLTFVRLSSSETGEMSEMGETNKGDGASKTDETNEANEANEE